MAMKKENKLQLFEEQNVRTHWDEEQEKWFFSVVDVVAILSESIDPQSYWRKLKQRLRIEGNETVTNCHGLKMLAKDGKRWQNETHRCSRYRAAFTPYATHPITQSRAI